ncbi:MAG: DUF2249 domain-containing protein [Ignavibacteriae bacterium]|nr:DUF2249 domain-containing protein [Ignavibacteriota bacterium]NOG98583.1 DUF2249 domain-containing protein [Ignavibacteriota bacterium]
MAINKITFDHRLNQGDYEAEKIFNTYKKINEGDEIALLTKSDPKKLYYKLFSKTRGSFHWVPLKEGPNEWKVIIEKSLTI